MKEEYPDKFYVMRVKERHLNRDIKKFEKEHPNYEVFNIGAFGTGGQLGGTSHWYVIWKLKDI